jgi:hypothetical protein
LYRHRDASHVTSVTFVKITEPLPEETPDG